MTTFLFIIGLIIGLFLWSNIWGGLFASIPMQRKMVLNGTLPKVDWITIIGSMLFGIITLSVTAIFIKPFFIGTIPSGIIILFNVNRLKAEEAEKLQKK